jgi:two-component system, OmpR family, sensor histidine kinase KdpD
LRTPLSVISASASSLLRYGSKLPVETQTDLLETVLHHSERLDRLTGKLLSLGRIEGGLITSKMPVVDVLEILGSALRTIRTLATGRKIEKDFQVESALVKADASLLEQVFFNVLENAVVHTPDHCSIRVLVTRTGDLLKVHIDDDGPGISSDDAETIFDRFAQGSNQDRQRVGAGLGLSIARGFARAVGGDVEVSGKQDGSSGTRFSIILPFIEQPVISEDAASN